MKDFRLPSPTKNILGDTHTHKNILEKRSLIFVLLINGYLGNTCVGLLALSISDIPVPLTKTFAF